MGNPTSRAYVPKLPGSTKTAASMVHVQYSNQCCEMPSYQVIPGWGSARSPRQMPSVGGFKCPGREQSYNGIYWLWVVCICSWRLAFPRIPHIEQLERPRRPFRLSTATTVPTASGQLPGPAAGAPGATGHFRRKQLSCVAVHDNFGFPSPAS